MDLSPAEMEKRGLMRCKTCSQVYEEKSKAWHQCPARKRGARRGILTKAANRLSALREQEKMMQAKEIAVRRILFRQTEADIAEGMKITADRVHHLSKSNAYKVALADLNARVSEREKAAFEHVEARMIEASDLAADKVLAILRDVSIHDEKALATLAKLSTDVLKMRGHEKPKEQRTEIQVSLSPDTIALMRKSDEEFDKVAAIELADSDYSHAVDFGDEKRQLPAPAAASAPRETSGAEDDPEPPSDFVEETP